MRMPAKVLLVDDSSADIDLTREALAQSHLTAHVIVAMNGVDALTILRQQLAEMLPDLVILDLNLPGKDGRTVLCELKNDPGLRATPVVVFSTSAAHQDVRLCYELGANCYVTKPGNLKEFMAAVASIGNYWFNFTRLPREED